MTYVTTKHKLIQGVHYKRLDPNKFHGMKYELLCDVVHYGYSSIWTKRPTNRKKKTMKAGQRFNGANCVRDLVVAAFGIHDTFCEDPFWDDGTEVTNLVASWEYRRVLGWHGHALISRVRFYATFMFGGKKVKEQNGWV